MENRRLQRVTVLIQEELARILQRKIKDPRIQTATITKVSVSADLRHVKVYVVTHDTSDEAIRNTLKGLKNATGFIKAQVATNLALRLIPEFHFFYDKQFEQSTRIIQTLDELFPTPPAAEDIDVSVD